MKKYGFLLMAALLVCAMTTACSMNNGANSAVPTPTLMTSPGFGGTSGLTPAATGGVGLGNDSVSMTAAMTTAESAALSKKANDAAEQVSEIDDCVTAIVGNTCLAGVTFDRQYRGEMTERIRDMVSARIQSVAPSVERVAVTCDPEIAAQINTVAQKIAMAGSLGEVTAEFDGVLGRIK